MKFRRASRRSKYPVRRGRKRYGQKQGRSRSIVKRVKRLERITKSMTPTLNLRWSVAPTDLTTDITVIRCCDYFGGSVVFGTDGDDLQSPIVKHISNGLDLTIEMDDEQETTTYTMFVVSLKDEATDAWNSTTGALTLVANQHYSNVGGMAMLNKKYFKIHNIQRFATGNHGAAQYAPSGLDDSRVRIRRYIKIPIGTTVRHPNGNWNTLVCPRDPSQNYYVLIMSNTTAIQGSPKLQYNMIGTFKSGGL